MSTSKSAKKAAVTRRKNAIHAEYRRRALKAWKTIRANS